MNVFSELVHSVYDLKSYRLFLKDKKGKTFLFGFLLVLLYFLVTVILPFVQFQVSTGGIMNIAEKLVPDFTIADGRLDMERQFEFAEGDTYIFVDTKNEEMAEEKILENLREYSSVMILDSRNAIIKSKGQVQTLYFSEIGDMKVSKADPIEMLRTFVAKASVLIQLLT